MIGLLQKAGRRLARLGPPRPTILMYHRIAEPAFDPWGLAVSPALFEEQLRMLNRRRSPMSMDEFVDRWRRRRLPADAAAITFDDGYLDNLTLAKPRLEAAGVPATVFVTTGRIEGTAEFWWDELARIVLGGQEPVDVEIAIDGQPCRLHFTGAPDEAPRPAWRAWKPPSRAREAAYLDLWSRLRRCRPAMRDAAMARLRAGPSAPPADDSRQMDFAEIERLSSSLSIGAHGVSHQPLPDLEPEARVAEIRESGETCRAVTGQAVAGFAFPHGAQDEATRRMVAEAGYSWACSTESRSLRPEDDPYRLPRLQVGDVGGAALGSAMRRLPA